MSRYTRRTFLTASGAIIGGLALGTTAAAAERADRFIVDTTDVSRAELADGDFSVVYDLAAIDLAVVEGPASAVKKVSETYAPDVELHLKEPEANSRAPTVDALDASARDEPYYGLQWDKQVQNVPEVHSITQGKGALVAVIDSGVAASHPDLDHAVNVELSRSFAADDFGVGGPYGGYHGTHVAGIVAAGDDNELGIVGTAPEAEIVDCRVFSTTGGASFASVIAAMVYAAEIDCDVANLSLGAYPIPRQALAAFYGQTLNRAMTYANASGTLLVTSAGNDAADLQHDKNFISLPNEGAQAVAVSATGPVGYLWGESGLEAGPKTPAIYTNYGTNAITIAAPGGNYDPEAYAAGVPGWYYDLVLSTIGEYTEFTTEGEPVEESLSLGYGWAAGTSMAAPQVAGAAALVKSANPGYGPNQIEATLKRTAAVPAGFDKTYYGAGFLDLLGAVRE
jgi:subtilisin family serine protease